MLSNMVRLNMNDLSSKETLMRQLLSYVQIHALKNRTFTGAMLVKEGRVVLKEMTTVEVDHHVLAHAELKLIRKALSRFDNDLSSYSLYTTQKPCVMCASAIVWSGIKEVVFGLNTNHHWKEEYTIQQFFSSHQVRVIGPILEHECLLIDELLQNHGI